jgi:hypothetical protein
VNDYARVVGPLEMLDAERLRARLPCARSMRAQLRKRIIDHWHASRTGTAARVSKRAVRQLRIVAHLAMKQRKSHVRVAGILAAAQRNLLEHLRTPEERCLIASPSPNRLFLGRALE